jgi:hypothetical protein
MREPIIALSLLAITFVACTVAVNWHSLLVFRVRRLIVLLLLNSLRPLIWIIVQVEPTPGAVIHLQMNVPDEEEDDA